MEEEQKRGIPKTAFQLKTVRKMFGNDIEGYNKFVERYKDHKGGWQSYWNPTEEDVKLFHQNTMTAEEWRKHWNVKRPITVYYRIGRMYLNKN